LPLALQEKARHPGRSHVKPYRINPPFSQLNEQQLPSAVELKVRRNFQKGDIWSGFRPVNCESPLRGSLRVPGFLRLPLGWRPLAGRCYPGSSQGRCGERAPPPSGIGWRCRIVQWRNLWSSNLTALCLPLAALVSTTKVSRQIQMAPPASPLPGPHGSKISGPLHLRTSLPAGPA